MNPEVWIKNALEPALKLLPEKMDSQAARAELVAIGLQESRLKYRAQIGGPARGYHQFEMYARVLLFWYWMLQNRRSALIPLQDGHSSAAGGMLLPPPWRWEKHVVQFAEKMAG